MQDTTMVRRASDFIVPDAVSTGAPRRREEREPVKREEGSDHDATATRRRLVQSCGPEPDARFQPFPPAPASHTLHGQYSSCEGTPCPVSRSVWSRVPSTS